MLPRTIFCLVNQMLPEGNIRFARENVTRGMFQQETARVCAHRNQAVCKRPLDKFIFIGAIFLPRSEKWCPEMFVIWCNFSVQQCVRFAAILRRIFSAKFARVVGESGGISENFVQTGGQLWRHRRIVGDAFGPFGPTDEQTIKKRFFWSFFYSNFTQFFCFFILLP